jgi:hypothetical protein
MPKPRAYHKAPNFTLVQWSEAGDVLASFELYHRQTVHQMSQDVMAEPPTSQAPPHYVIYLGKDVPIHFFKNLFGSRQHITLLIDPQTPREAMMRHWPEIQAWRRRLESWQGFPHNRGQYYLANLKGWHQVWREGAKAQPSLAELARWVNNEIAVELEGAYVTIRDAHGDTPPIPIGRLLEYPSWQLPRAHWSAALAHPVWLMELWGIRRKDIRDSCLHAFENLKAGKPTFPNSDEPISREHIWAKLKRLATER